MAETVCKIVMERCGEMKTYFKRMTKGNSFQNWIFLHNRRSTLDFNMNNHNSKKCRLCNSMNVEQTAHN